jgi:hypothetical protein
MQFCFYSCDVTEEKIMMRVTLAASTTTLPCKIMFRGNNLLKKQEKVLVDYKEEINFTQENIGGLHLC